MTRIEDIAKKLDVSKSTVSKALNGAPDVSETLRKTVLETAVELGYSVLPESAAPNSCASLLKIWPISAPMILDMILLLGFEKWQSLLAM